MGTPVRLPEPLSPNAEANDNPPNFSFPSKTQFGRCHLEAIRTFSTVSSAESLKTEVVLLIKPFLTSLSFVVSKPKDDVNAS